MGQSGTAVAGALGACRSHQSSSRVHSTRLRALPTTPSLRREADQASGRAYNPAHPRQRVCCAGNQSGRRTRASADRTSRSARRAPEDPLLLFSVLYGFWVASYVAFDGDVMRELAAHFLALAEKQGATVPLMVGHRLVGISLFCTGDIAARPGAFRPGNALP